MDNKDIIAFLAKGGSSDVSPADVVTATGQMTDQQAGQTRENLGAAPASTVVTDLSSTSITLSAQNNTEYHYGELSALTISSFPASGKFWIWFTSGATPTTTTGIRGFAAEANKVYRITVENGYATFDSWPTT